MLAPFFFLGEPGRRPLRMTARARGRHGRRPSLRRHGTLRHGMVPYPPPTPFVRPTRHMYPEFNTFARFPAPRFTYPRRRFPRGPGRYFPPIPSAHRPVTATRKNNIHVRIQRNGQGVRIPPPPLKNHKKYRVS